MRTTSSARLPRFTQILARLVLSVLVLILGLTTASSALQQRTGPLKEGVLPHKQPAMTAIAPEPDASTKANVQAGYGKLSLSFEANQGRDDERVQFLSRGSGYTMFLMSTEAVLAFRQKSAAGDQWSERADSQLAQLSILNSRPLTAAPQSLTVLHMHLVGANPQPHVAGLEELPGKSHYFRGNDPKQWRTNIATYAKVKYREVYPGVDVVYYGNQRQLEYDFIVAPGTDPSIITLAFEGTDQLEVDAQGDLILYTTGRPIRLQKPLIYQEVDGVKRHISGGYVVRPLPIGERRGEGKPQVGFQVAAYDPRRPLIIDPILDYSTYLGTSNQDQAGGIAVDSIGNAYVTGFTDSPNFPTTAGAFETTQPGGRDAFVTKLNTTGSALVYSTYLGGSCDDLGGGRFCRKFRF